MKFLMLIFDTLEVILIVEEGATMLIKFTVENYRSYKEESSILLTSASKIQEHPEHIKSLGDLKLLKFAGIYGDNASGKTNILKAAGFLKSLLVPSGLPVDLDFAFKDNGDNPTKIEIVFAVDKYIYQYGIKCQKQTSPFLSLEIVDEYLNIIGNKAARSKSLYALSTGVNPSLLEGKDISGNPFTIYFNGYKQLCKPITNTLFLSFINGQDKVLPDGELKGHFQRVYDFIRNNMVVIGANTMNMNYINGNYLKTIEKYVEEFDPSIEQIDLVSISKDDIVKQIPESFLSNIISQLYTMKEDTITISLNNSSFYFLSKDSSGDVKCETLTLKHKFIESPFQFAEESEGTRKFIVLMSFFADRNKTKVFFLDELERSMHPSSSDYIFDFFTCETKDMDTQFIFTTHNTRFMKKSLRRDEIFFSEKDLYGVSVIYPLTDFPTRSDSPLEKMFLEGKFRKIPDNGRKLFDDNVSDH
jgi:AAA15 family ATPase/GTPase